MSFMAEKRLYVGNLPYSMTTDSPSELFTAHGKVVSANVVIDRANGRSRGFGFVEMGTEEEAQTAASTLNGQEVGGRELVVNIARPRTENTDRGGYNKGRRGGYNDRSGGYDE